MNAKKTRIWKQKLREDLAAKEGMSESVAQQYERLIGEFEYSKSSTSRAWLHMRGRSEDYNSEVTK